MKNFCRNLLFISLCLALLCNGAAAQTTKTQVMILGVYHFHNPNADYVKTEFDDHLSAKRQQQIAETLALLAEFKPTKIALEALPTDTNIQNDYAAFLKGEYKLTANERDQLGFRLAQRLGHKQVYLIDHHIGMDLDGLMKAAQQTNNRAFLASFQKTIGLAQQMLKQQVNKTVRESLIEWNEPALLAQGRELYLQMARVRSGDQFIGADVLTNWYQRNFRIFTNLIHVIESPQERVLVVFGNAHAPILRELVQSSPDLQLVEASDYLKKKP